MSNKQQPDFSEDGSGIMRKSLPNQSLCSASWEETLGLGQMERNRTGDPKAPLLADRMGPGSRRKFRSVPVRVRAI